MLNVKINLINYVGERRQPGESGGNVHIIFNEIINGQNWTIVSDGGDGSSAFKWTREEFEKSFPSMSTGDKGKAMETVLTTLKQILQKGERWRGENILPGHKGNFIIEGGSNDGNYITAIFYETHFSLFKKENQTFIHIKGRPKNQFQPIKDFLLTLKIKNILYFFCRRLCRTRWIRR